jgi:hypothetical protein
MAKDLIQSILEPRIELVKLTTSDDSIDSTESIVKNISNQKSQRESTGSREPFVKINNSFITGIDELILDESGILPTIKVSFIDSIGSMSGPNYPKHDQIISIFIKNPTSKFKPIRCDFLITNIKTLTDHDSKKTFDTYFIIYGELFIPKLYNNISKSYPGLSSKAALNRVAEDSDLGYATNDFTTSDKMTWINTNDSQIDFIEDVTRHAYLDDDSFFNSFIDKYYYLNMINVTEQLNPKNQIRNTFQSTIELDQLETAQWLKDEALKREFEETEVPLVLTNKPGNSKSPNFILSYSLMGESGRSLKTKGHRRRIYYYDHSLTEDRFTSFYVKPVGIKGSNPNPEPGIEPNNEYLKSNEIKKWIGIQYDNVHSEWNAAAVINDHNISELNKIKLKVTTPGVNYSVIRGSSIPVGIFIPSDRKRIQDSNRNDIPNIDADTVSQYSYEQDLTISGRYYVNSIRYIYDKEEKYRFRTEFELTRTNWYNENNII